MKETFLQLLNVHGVKDVRQTAIHTAEPLVTEPSVLVLRCLLKRLKTNHQVLIKSQENRLQPGVEQFEIRSVNLLILFVIKRNCLSCGSIRTLYLSSYNKSEKTDFSNYRDI